MQVSTKLFNQQAVNQFGKLTEEIQNLQAKVSTGKNILKSSDDPVAAVELSAAKEQRNILERFKRNVDSAQRRLDLADTSIQQAINVMTRISELAIQAANDTNSNTDKGYLQKEVDVLLAEINRIADQTTFNNQKVLDGSFKEKIVQLGANSGQNVEFSINALNTSQMGNFLGTGSILFQIFIGLQTH